MKLGITEQEFINLYKQLTYNELSEQLGLSRNKIANLAKQLGLNKPVGRKKEQITFKKDGGTDEI